MDVPGAGAVACLRLGATEPVAPRWRSADFLGLGTGGLANFWDFSAAPPGLRAHCARLQQLRAHCAWMQHWPWRESWLSDVPVAGAVA